MGYNTITSLYYLKKEKLDIKVNIFSPELDRDLVASLKEFQYPKEFEEFLPIIKELSKNGFYQDENIKIELYLGDAREYIKSLKKEFFHIIYQDAFSSEVNMELWTKEYFDDIYKISKSDVVMSTYAIATPIRLSMYEAGFFIYQHRPKKRKITLATKTKTEFFAKYIDMELKKQRNKEAKAIYDKSN